MEIHVVFHPSGRNFGKGQGQGPNRHKSQPWKSEGVLKHKNLHSLKLTFSPLKIGLPNRKVVFQPFIFRGELLVSGRVHPNTCNSLECWNNFTHQAKK